MVQSSTQQRSLFDSERRFRQLVEGVVDYAIYMLNPDGIITNWNAGARRIKGYEADEVIGRHFGMFYLPEDRAAGMPARSIATAREKGKFEAEGWRLRKDGTKFLASIVIDAIYEDGELIGFAKITRDITERNKSSEALKESERHFRLLVNGVTDYALYMLDPNGIITNWNVGGQRIKGYLPGEIIGQNFSRFYSPADQAAGRPARALRLALENGRYDEEGWRVRKDGTFFWASVVIDPIRDDEGKLLGFAKITRDISERREAQLNLEKIQRQLAESQKLDALGQLTGGVAHDFNNLLMVITGHLHMLKKIAGNDAKSLRAIQAIETATQRGASLTRQLLTFARRQNVNPQSIDLRDSIHSVREVLNTGLGSAVQLRIDLDDGLWPVMVDPAELETALVNLIINARDAMPGGGSVSVRANNIHLDDGARKGDHVAIEVKDTGMGIPPDIVAKVFDPFFTTKPIGKGNDVHHLPAARKKASRAAGGRSTLGRQRHGAAGRRQSRCGNRELRPARATWLFGPLGLGRGSSPQGVGPRRHRSRRYRHRDAWKDRWPRSRARHPAKTSWPADPSGHRLQRGRSECACRFFNTPQAISATRAEP